MKILWILLVIYYTPDHLSFVLSTIKIRLKLHFCEVIDFEKRKKTKQAGAELGQAQLKLELQWDQCTQANSEASNNSSKHKIYILARACGVPAVGVRAVDCWQ